jgi:RNA polymerase sigma-70 factor (ECF subfamily)
MPPPDTEELLDLAAAGDESARGQLLQLHRDRLRRMVAVRADPRLAARVDPSDIVQETLAAAAARLDAYLKDRPVAFYPWLRQLAEDRLGALHRRHVRAERRSVTREEGRLGLPDESAMALADRLLARQSSPSAHAQWEELRARVRRAMVALPDVDREILVLRLLEGLPAKDIADVLGMTVGAVRTRQARALVRLQSFLA